MNGDRIISNILRDGMNTQQSNHEYAAFVCRICNTDISGTEDMKPSDIFYLFPTNSGKQIDDRENVLVRTCPGLLCSENCMKIDCIDRGE